MLRFMRSILGRFIVLAMVLTVIWLLLSTYFDNTVLLVFGLVSVFFVTVLAHRAGMLDAEGVPTRIFPGILGYWVWLTFEIGKANLAVAKQVLAPSLSPTMFRVPTDQKSDVGRVIFANSVTLTPGTVSVDLADGSLLIHALTEELADEQAILEMGARVSRFDHASERGRS